MVQYTPITKTIVNFDTIQAENSTFWEICCIKSTELKSSSPFGNLETWNLENMETQNLRHSETLKLRNLLSTALGCFHPFFFYYISPFLTFLTNFNHCHLFSSIFHCFQPFCIGGTLCNRLEVQCLRYAGFLAGPGKARGCSTDSSGIQSLTDPLVKISLRRRHALIIMVLSVIKQTNFQFCRRI